MTDHRKSAILVVDDEASILHYVRRVLERIHYAVMTSLNGDHGWDVFERGSTKIDLALTDLVMPGSIDGLTLAAKIRKGTQNCPFCL